MSSGPSFENFDYLLRSNKGIERRLIFDLLHRASGKLDLHNHQYLGLGSVSFGDFRLAHRILGLTKMSSVERDGNSGRAGFNAPYRCVTVLSGEIGAVMAGFSDEVWRRPMIAWLDYDTRITEGYCNDIERILQNAAANSVIIVTVNGVRNRYKKIDPSKHMRSRDETLVGVIESMLGRNTASVRFEPHVTPAGIFNEISEEMFPELLATTILNFMRHKVTHGARQVGAERLVFVPLFNYSHKDGSCMVTVGGALAYGAAVASWQSEISSESYDADGNPLIERLDLIPLTIKEKLALDTCLPLPDIEFLEAAKTLGVSLADDQLLKYQRYYRQLPVYVESSI